MIRIIIADDHTIFREGLRKIIEDSVDMKVVGEASDCNEVLEVVETTACDVVLLDLSMPGRGGMNVLTTLRKEYPKLPVLILSLHPEQQYGVAVIKAGAAGYVNKANASDELLKSIRKVSNGGKAISDELTQILIEDLNNPGRNKLPHDRLTNREKTIFLKIADGYKIKEIANELNNSPSTISNERKRILEKMNMTRDAQLIRYAVENRLMESTLDQPDLQ